MNSITETARSYLKRGWKPINFPLGQKFPQEPKWEQLRLTEADLPRRFGTPCNVGVLTGEPSGWLIDLDLDNPVARELADKFLPVTGAIFGRASSRRSHWLYRVSSPIVTYKPMLPAGVADGHERTIVEVRGTGLQTVFPGSTHPSGESVEWDEEGEPALVDPSELRASIDRLVAAVKDRYGVRQESAITPPRPRSSIEERAEKYLAAIPPAIAGQAGHNHTFRAACVLVLGFELSTEQAFPILQGWNQSCSPPWSDKELLHKLESANKQAGPRGWLVEERANYSPAKADHYLQKCHESKEAAPRKSVRTPGRYQSFPLEFIPPPIRLYIDSASEAIGCDTSCIALPMLAALGSAIGNTRRIALKSSWLEPPILWTTIVGDSGALKSPGQTAGTEPLEVVQNKHFADHQAAMQEFVSAQLEYQGNLENWKREKKGLRGDAPDAPQCPVMPRVIVSDVTVEALAARLQDSPRGLLLVRDELAGWLQSFNQYKSGAGGDVAHWLSMYGAKPLRVDRKTDSAFTFVPMAAVSLTGGIQPETLKRCLSTEHFENGLAARLLLAMPPKRPRIWNEYTTSEKSKRAVADIFNKLLALDFVTDEEGNAAPAVLPLNDQAKEVWVTFYNKHGIEQAELTGREAALWSKLEGTAPRLALIIHCVRVASNDADPDAIDETSMTAAVGLAEWFGAEATRVYEMLGETDEQKEDRRLIELIQRKGGTVTPREVNQSCRWIPDVEAAEIELNRLAQGCLGEWVTIPPSPKGGRPSRVFRLSTPSTSPKPQITAENQSYGYVDTVDTESPA